MKLWDVHWTQTATYYFPLFVAVAVLDLNQTVLADDSIRSDEMLECIARFFAAYDVHVVISHA